MIITAPFNFVPMSGKVVFPKWADRISHDIPFSDGVSGTISVRLTAKTPIFVRNGHSKKDADEKSDAYRSFSNINGRCFIPSTSVKGTVRNVLEIMSFGKMRLDKNAKFAQREWNNPSLYPLKAKQGDLHCGWLKQDGDHYSITDCGKPLRISHIRLDECFHSSVFEDNFSGNSEMNLNEPRNLGGVKYDPKTAVFKYKLIEQIDPSLSILRGKNFSEDEEYTNRYKTNRVLVSNIGEKGTIILTGQPDKWKFPRPDRMDPLAGKFYEFVFPDRNHGEYAITEEEFNHYKFIYADSPDWEYACEKFLPIYGIPVFFRVDGEGNNKHIKDWGLSFLYKLPYDKTPYETLDMRHRSDALDMADCIFGYISKDSSLKGRVRFSPFWCENAQKADAIPLTLSSPKASYYPIYIRQDRKGRGGIMSVPAYNTYNDGILKGWKRYHVRGGVWNANTNSDIDTEIYPVNAGAVFDGKISFHNLKPEELGALLSALTFHGNGYPHQIGMAKPYGYGQVSVEITGTSIETVASEVSEVSKETLSDPRFYMAVFEDYISNEIGCSWSSDNSIVELFSIAGKNIGSDDNHYMVLSVDGKNDFVDAKGGVKDDKPHEYYQYFTERCPNEKSEVNSLSSTFSEEIAARKRQIAEKIAERERQLQEAEARKRDEEAERERAEEELRKRLEEEERARAKEQRLQAGISFLSALDNKGEYSIKDFNSARKRLSEWLKKTACAKLPVEHYATLQDCIVRLAAKPVRNERKNWPSRNSNIWNFIEDITNAEFADNLYKKVNP